MDSGVEDALVVTLRPVVGKDASSVKYMLELVTLSDASGVNCVENMTAEIEVENIVSAAEVDSMDVKGTMVDCGTNIVLGLAAALNVGNAVSELEVAPNVVIPSTADCEVDSALEVASEVEVHEAAAESGTLMAVPTTSEVA